MHELAQKLGDYTLFSGRDSQLQQQHQNYHQRIGSFGSDGMGQPAPYAHHDGEELSP